MPIDWFTVGAQALNFLILVWLLKRFLYEPVLNAIAEREKRIATRIADADAKDAAAEAQRADFEHKNAEFDGQRDALFAKAKGDAKAERQRLLDEARRAADELSAKRQEARRNEADQLHQAVARRAQQEVFAITRRALSDMATTGLEERLVAVFTRRLSELDADAKASLGKALTASAEPVLVRSAFELPAEERATIQNALNETFSADLHLRFETDPDVISGIEVAAGGQKFAWTLASYIKSLSEGVDALLTESELGKARDPKPAPEPVLEVSTKSAADTRGT